MDTEKQQLKIFFKTMIVTGVSFILGLFFDYFFYDKVPGLAFPLYVFLIIGILFIFSKYFQKKIDREVVFLLIPLAFFSTMVFVRSSILLTFLNIVASILLLLLIAKISFREKIENFLVNDYLKICFLPLKFIGPLFETLYDLITLKGIKKDQKMIVQIVKGILITIPIVFLFLFLFSSADLIFQKYLSNFINIDIEEETVFRLILIAISTFSFIGAYSYIFRKSEEEVMEKKNRLLTITQIEASILLISVNILFGIFICIQLAYLFGGESNISSQGFSYATYARKGFFELIAVAVISFLLVWNTEKNILKKEQDKEHTVLFKILSSLLIVQVMIIMGSAFKRLFLYEEAYGFTMLRLYSHAFIILLGIIFLFLLYKIYKDKKENTFAFRIFLSMILFLGIMNGINPDAFIAQKNIERFKSTGKLDLYYLSQLSDDAIPISINILEIVNENEKKVFARDLYWRLIESDFSDFSQWQSLNIARINAKKILQAKVDEIEPYKDYREDSDNEN